MRGGRDRWYVNGIRRKKTSISEEPHGKQAHPGTRLWGPLFSFGPRSPRRDSRLHRPRAHGLVARHELLAQAATLALGRDEQGEMPVVPPLPDQALATPAGDTRGLPGRLRPPRGLAQDARRDPPDHIGGLESFFKFRVHAVRVRVFKASARCPTPITRVRFPPPAQARPPQ